MSEGNDQDGGKGRLSLRPAARLEVGRTVDAGSVRQTFSHGRSKVVQVEVRKSRSAAPAKPAAAAGAPSAAPGNVPLTARSGAPAARPAPGAGRALTATELAARQRALVEQQRDSARREAERREQEKISILSAAEEARRKADEDARREAEESERRKVEEAEARVLAVEEALQAAEEARLKAADDEAAAEHARLTAEAVANGTEAPPPAPAPHPREPIQARAPQQQPSAVRGPAGRQGASAGRPGAAAPGGAPAAGETLRLRPGGARPGEEDDETRPVRRPGGIGVPPRKPAIVVAKIVIRVLMPL